MLFSASYAYSYEYYGNSYKFITRQAAFAAAGVALMLIISKIDYHFWRRFAWIVYVLAIGMLAVLLALPPMVKGMDVKRMDSFRPYKLSAVRGCKICNYTAVFFAYCRQFKANEKL